MKHGGYMEYGFYGSYILMILLMVAVIVFVIFMLDKNKKKNNPECNRLLEILKTRYTKDEINIDEYRERSIILEEDEWEDQNNSTITALRECYAIGEIDSKRFIEKINEINTKKFH